MGRPQGIDTRHIGADIPADVAEKFSEQCKERGFIISRVMSQFVTWWVAAPEELQKQFYHTRDFQSPELKILATPSEVRAYVESLLQQAQKSGRQRSGK